MTGYQEVLTDPSYCGQIVTMTAPEIGNVGVNARGHRGRRRRAAAWRGSSCATRARSRRTGAREESLDAYLARHGVVGITDVDTRKLTRHLRDKGSQNGAIGTDVARGPAPRAPARRRT